MASKATTKSAPKPQRWRGIKKTLRRRARRAARWAAIVGVLLIGWSLLERVLWGDQVLPGVRLAGVDVHGHDAADVRYVVTEAAVRIERDPVRIRIADTSLSQRSDVIKLQVDEQATALAALGGGRKGNLLGQLAGAVLRRFRADRVDWVLSYDRANVVRVIDFWAEEAGAKPSEGGLAFSGSKVKMIEPHPGTTVNSDEALRIVDASLRRNPSDTVVLPLRTVHPKISSDEVHDAAAKARRLLSSAVTVELAGKTLKLQPEQLGETLRATPRGRSLVLEVDTEKLRSALGSDLAQIETPGRDASFALTAAGVQVIPSQVGHELDIDAVAKAILRLERNVVGVFRDSIPERDTAWAKSLDITEKVSEFTTRHPAGQPRVKNIHLVADLVQNTIITPGQRFSLNKTIGPRTTERGFVRAPVIYDGVFSEDVGGGVSQFATTFFNAVFFGGYKIVSHRPHSYFIDRYPMGREATISVGGPDLVFINDSQSGILVRTAYTASSITVAFYGDKEGKTVKAEGPNVLATYEPGIDYVDDPSLPAGVEKELEKGRQGFLVEVFRVIGRGDATPVRQRFVTRYKTQNRKVNRGTGPPVPSTPTTAPTTTPTAPPAPAT